MPPDGTPRASEIALGAAVAEATQPSSTARAWRDAWAIFAIGFVLTMALFWETASFTVWTYIRDSTYNHGFIILPICGYLIWLRRLELAALVPEATPWALGLTALSGLGWLLGTAAGAVVVQQFGLLCMLWSLFLAVFGWRVTRLLWFPLSYAVFAIPFGRSLVPPLQDITAALAVRGIELLNIPVYSDGVLISIPHGNFEVAEACAGIRFLIATLALGCLFSYLSYRSNWRRAIFIVLCLIVPIIANGIRAFGIVLIGYLSDMEAAVGTDHIIYGWVFFALITAMLLAVGMAFRDREMGEPHGQPGVPMVIAPPSRARLGAMAIAVLAVSAVWPIYESLAVNRPPQAAPIAFTAPTLGNGWRPVPERREGWRPVFDTADAKLLQSYTKDGRTAHLFIAYYAYQRERAEVVNFQNKVYDSRYWLRAGSGSAEAAIDGTRLTVDATRLLQNQRGLVVWSWNWVDGVYTANPYVSTLLATRAKLLGGSKSAAFIAVSADYAENPAEADPVLRDFVASLPSIRALLARAKGG